MNRLVYLWLVMWLATILTGVVRSDWALWHNEWAVVTFVMISFLLINELTLIWWRRRMSELSPYIDDVKRTLSPTESDEHYIPRNHS